MNAWLSQMQTFISLGERQTSDQSVIQNVLFFRKMTYLVKYISFHMLRYRLLLYSFVPVAPEKECVQTPSWSLRVRQFSSVVSGPLNSSDGPHWTLLGVCGSESRTHKRYGYKIGTHMPDFIVFNKLR